MTRIVVCDLDNTLLHSDKTISEYTSNVFKKLRNEDFKVVFATARPKRAIVNYNDAIQVDAYIVHNGACIFIADKLYFHYGIDSNITEKVLTSIASDNAEANLAVEIDDEIYANFDTTTIWPKIQAIQTDFTDLPSKSAEKMIIQVSSKADIEKFSNYLPNILYIEMNEGNLGLVMNKQATKLNAIKKLVEHYHCELKDVIAFGDDYNDLEMLKNCGVGVAVSNAISEVKAVADFICSSNDEDGVAHWIESHLL